MFDLPFSFTTDPVEIGSFVQPGPLLSEEPVADQIVFEDAPVNTVELPQG